MNGARPAFGWPASRGGRRPAARAIDVDRGPRRETWWQTFEREWLAPTAMPLRIRAAEAGWSPDEADAYCDRCGSSIGPHEATEFGCASCTGRRMRWDRVVRLGSYERDLAEWIQEVKFTRWRGLGLALGRWLGERVRDAGFLEAAAAAGLRPLVVAAPMSFRRRMARGIDHSRVIAAGVAQELGVDMRGVLRREHRPSQRSVSAAQRARNVAGSMRCVRIRLDRRLVLLVDDVMTSGATLRTAARALEGRGKRPGGVWAAVLGVTPGVGRRVL